MSADRERPAGQQSGESGTLRETVIIDARQWLERHSAAPASTEVVRETLQNLTGFFGLLAEWKRNLRGESPK